MEPNDNPPCEREWTITEREEFFAWQDARTGLLNGEATNNTSFHPGASYHNCGNELAKNWLATGIFVTSIVPPEHGWPIAMYCPICKETTFILSPSAIKPKDGDYWRAVTCARDGVHIQHNMKMGMDMYNSATKGVKNVSELEYAIRMLGEKCKNSPPEEIRCYRSGDE